ncbi:DEAD/DEAH box helicase [Streptomyces griseocarneus]|nr:DEAD/DEAH box helicase [Streptomyces griseocarneus]
MCTSEGSGPARQPAFPGRTLPPARYVRPPSPLRAASHRRGKILSTLSTTFREIGILPETAEALEAVGIVHPFPIQEMTLPVALSGSDVIGQAKTGTGKTLGFGLPLLERVVVPADVEAGRAKPEQLTDAPQALVVVPTRELCQQVTNDLLTAGKVRNVRVQAIYGGRAYEPQVEALQKGVDVVVGTPGRLLDLAGQKKLDLSHVKALVLDEADEMLDLGFLPDVERIITMLPAKRQTMLFSATMPGAVIGLARRYMSRPTHIRATEPDDDGRQTHAHIAQHVFRAHNMDKPEMVARLLQAEGRNRAMIFCRTKRTAADIAEQLTRRGFAAGAVHGDLGQGAREQALRAFRNGKVDVLVCTDVAARGIDVDDVTHVVNYQTPEDEKTYLHRIGRTGRAGKSGTAVTLVDWDDVPRWKLINKALGQEFDEPEETYSTSPHFYELLKIPAGTKGILPRSERKLAGLAAEEIEDLGETGARGGGRGGRNGGRKPAAETEERPERTRTPRQRRRTRGGAGAGTEAAVAASAPASASVEVASVDAAPVAEGAPATPAKPRRRRTRSRRGSDAPVATAATAVAPTATAVTVTAEKPEPVAVKAEAPAAATEAPAPQVKAAAPRVKAAAPAAAPAPVQQRRRRARVVRPEPVDTVDFQTVESAAAALAAARKAIPAQATEPTAEPVVEPAKPKRTRKVTAAAAPAAPAETVEPEAPAKPKRTRKTAAPKAEAVEAVEVEVAEVKPKRTRKAAAPKAEVAETVTEAEAPAKPKRIRKTAAAKVEAADGEAVEVAEVPEVKPKRTRKAAAPKAETAEAETEAPAKPKRTRKAAAPKAETTEVEAEAPAKPKRTRKTAAAKIEAVDGETVEVAEVKPKRTRKAAAPKAETTEAETEAPAKPKRTRKTAAAKVASES